MLDNPLSLDALLFPGSSSANIAARATYPTVIVPYGFIPNAPAPAFPAGFNARDQPYGVGFTGPAVREEPDAAAATEFSLGTASLARFEQEAAAEFEEGQSLRALGKAA